MNEEYGWNTHLALLEATLDIAEDNFPLLKTKRINHLWFVVCMQEEPQWMD